MFKKILISYAFALSFISFIFSTGVLLKMNRLHRNSKIQYVMYIGTNDKDTYTQIIPTETAKEIVNNTCLNYFDGYTIQDARGVWKDEAGKTTGENSIICYFDDADASKIHAAADEIIKKLNQSTILIEKNVIQMEYYTGDKKK